MTCWSGSTGANALIGNDGIDILAGLGGADTLTGGADADTFQFLALSDSRPTAPDVITDFQQGQDKIDVAAIVGAVAATFHFLGVRAVRPCRQAPSGKVSATATPS